MLAARRRTLIPIGLALSEHAHLAFFVTLERALKIARAEASRRGTLTQGFLDATRHLEAIFDSPLLQTGRPGPLTLDHDRRYTLRCVFAWATRGAAPAVRLELRRFARLIGVTR